MITICSVLLHTGGTTMIRGNFLLVIFTIVLLFSLTACQNKSSFINHEEGKISIYTTVFPLKDFAEKIGGEFVQVETIYPPGADEHTYEPSQRDIIDMAESDLFLYIGFGLEPFAENAKKILTDEGVRVLAVGEEIELHEHEESSNHHEDDGHNHGTINPHLWLDPFYAKQMANIILNELVELLPEKADYFKDNYNQLEQKFKDLDESFRNTIEKGQLNSFLVSHAAYSYWESRYGLEQISISGLSTSEEPSHKELISIIDQVIEKGIKTILIEQNVSTQLADIIAKEGNLEKLPIHNLSVLTETDIDNGEDYFSLMEQNIKTLEKVLNP